MNITFTDEASFETALDDVMESNHDCMLDNVVESC